MNGNDNSHVDWLAQVVRRSYRCDRGLYALHRWCICANRGCACPRTDRNYLRHRIPKSSPSLANDRTKSAKLVAWSWILPRRASEIRFAHLKFVAGDDTRAHTDDSPCRVRYLSQFSGKNERQKYARKSSGNAAKCTICSVDLLSFTLRWL